MSACWLPERLHRPDYPSFHGTLRIDDSCLAAFRAVLRAKGFFWLCSRPSTIGIVHLAGKNIRVEVRDQTHWIRFVSQLIDLDCFGWIYLQLPPPRIFACALVCFPLQSSGSWFASIPKEDWPTEESFKEMIKGCWEEPFGDRMQELVLIGVDMDQKTLTKVRTRCVACCLQGLSSFARA